ncbi:MAG: acireductone synthase [Vampirovibrionales bacterium]|nr:acireductone synthase [Vampirovibrionales bacterium]
MIQAVLTDIEGTTSSLSFVKDVLFPYARARLADYCKTHDLADIFNAVRTLQKNPDLTRQAIIEVLQRWSDEDQKVAPLKQLQGLIWQAGYQQGDYQGHLYEDAYLALKRLHQQGVRLFVFSSGSIMAQQLLFAHTTYGDLTPWFDGFFDTTMGSKLASDSYLAIAREIGLPADEILFLSDHPKELNAAQEAGLQVLGVDRQEPGGYLFEAPVAYPLIRSFDAIQSLKFSL